MPATVAACSRDDFAFALGVVRAASSLRASAPAERGRDVGQDGFDHVRVVVDAELIGNGHQQSVGLGYRLVALQLLDEDVGLGRIAASEGRAGAWVDESDLVLIVALASEIGAVAIVHQGDDAAADRNPRFTRVAGLFPGGAVGTDLGGLLNVEGFSGLVALE